MLSENSLCNEFSPKLSLVTTLIDFSCSKQRYFYEIVLDLMWMSWYHFASPRVFCGHLLEIRSELQIRFYKMWILTVFFRLKYFRGIVIHRHFVIKRH